MRYLLLSFIFGCTLDYETVEKICLQRDENAVKQLALECMRSVSLTHEDSVVYQCNQFALEHEKCLRWGYRYHFFDRMRGEGRYVWCGQAGEHEKGLCRERGWKDEPR